MKYLKPEKLLMKLHPELSEKWVQEHIANDPAILGLGDLVLRDKERIQPRAGRLDLLLQDPESKRRYEVEIQLGSTDEAHIIRSIEYWDIERKRYPQYDHCAVIIAEDITSRFLNVISLFNGTIPLVAIQMQALKFGDGVALIFTKVMDELTRGVVDEDEDAEAAPTDRAYWEKKSAKPILSVVDELVEIAKGIDRNLEPKYNKFYIGLSRDTKAYNFVSFRTRRAGVYAEIKLPQSEDITKRIESANIELADYDTRWGRYRLIITPQDVRDKKEFIVELFMLAYDNYNS